MGGARNDHRPRDQRYAAILGALLLGACGSARATASDHTPSTSSSDATVEFVWPAEAEALVTMTRSLDDSTGTSQFTFRANANRSGVRDCTFSDFQLVDVPGVDLTDPEVATAVASMLAGIAAALPSFHVDADGAFASVGTFDDAQARLVEATGMQEFQGIDGNPIYERTVRDYWDAWHAFWQGASRRPGTVATRQSGRGAAVEIATLAADGETTSLRAVTSFRDHEMERVVAELALAEGRTFAPAITTTMTVDATLHAGTGLPLAVTTDQVRLITPPGGSPPRTQASTTRWEFAWQ